jgi:3-hydroxy-9,10-secoandrosta-1,3,5(10)-triene-9,17-dione monooxygenase
MSTIAPGGATLPIPEPELTVETLLERARSMRPLLLDEQAATEERGCPAPAVHTQFLDRGFYRMLQPRRFGGYEFDLESFCRMVIEIARGCPSTGWHIAFTAGHPVLLAELFGEQAQIDCFGPDGVFIAAGRIPMGTAAPADGGGWLVDGTWDYCSGSPYATHLLPGVVIPPADGEGPPRIGLAVVPREQWTLLDDWGDVLGMRGSGSNSVVIDKQLIPEHWLVLENLLAVDVSSGTEGLRLHGNSLYGGRVISLLLLQLGAFAVGTARATLDEYERILRSRTTMFPPQVPRYQSRDYQQPFGIAMGMVDTAESGVLGAARTHAALSRRGAEGGEPFSVEEDVRLAVQIQHCFRLAFDAVLLLFRTAGSSGGKNGSHMQRYYRDMSMAATHIALQADVWGVGAARLHFAETETFPY